MGIRELRKEAGRLGIKYSGLKKAELEPLVEAALAAEQNQTLPTTGDSSTLPAKQDDLSTVAKRLGAGSIEDTSAYLSLLDKGDARKVRKSLFRAGFKAHAAAPRLSRENRAAA